MAPRNSERYFHSAGFSRVAPNSAESLGSLTAPSHGLEVDLAVRLVRLPPSWVLGGAVFRDDGNGYDVSGGEWEIFLCQDRIPLTDPSPCVQ